MRIFVKAKPKAKEEKIEKIDSLVSKFRRGGEMSFIVAIKEPPEKGKANQAVIKKLAEYFKVPQSRIVLISGFSSKNKIFEIKK
ncbi:MAG: hypothetical protein C0412_20335 [Flavobacterium sp.]|nr:hypothetical protein [Flavobacterium sp.]